MALLAYPEPEFRIDSLQSSESEDRVRHSQRTNLWSLWHSCEIFIIFPTLQVTPTSNYEQTLGVSGSSP